MPPLSPEQPKVAIGLPTYNREFYLRQAVDSILAQTYKNFVLIISDNASPDGTQALCEEYARRDPRIRYIRQKENIGQVPNADFLLKQLVATADFCMLTSDDDIFDPRFFEVCMPLIASDPNAAMAFTGHESFFWEDGRVIPRDPKRYFPEDKDLYRRLKEFILFYSHDNRNVCIYGVWHKKIIEHEQLRDRYEDDVSFALRNLSRGYFLMADRAVLFRKGIVPGIRSVTQMPAGISKLIAGVKVRFARAKTEFSSMRFLLGVTALPLSKRCALVGWNLVVVIRLFTRRRV